jgi:hypothetical protein
MGGLNKVTKCFHAPSILAHADVSIGRLCRVDVVELGSLQSVDLELLCKPEEVAAWCSGPVRAKKHGVRVLRWRPTEQFGSRVC